MYQRNFVSRLHFRQSKNSSNIFGQFLASFQVIKKSFSQFLVFSVTRSLAQNLAILQQIKMAQQQMFNGKVGSKFAKYKNKHLKCCQKLLTYCPIGEISPNLVTLVVFSFVCFSRTRMNEITDSREKGLSSQNLATYNVEIIEKQLLSTDLCQRYLRLG